MIFEKIFFYVVAIALAVIIFLKMMRKNDIAYLISLILQALRNIYKFYMLDIQYKYELIY